MNPFVQSSEDAAATQLIKEVFDNLPEESERRNPKQPPCCSITEFPEFVKSQNIERLDISNNKIKGQVPGWLWTLSNLYYLDISNNSFTGFKNAKKHGLSLMTLLASNNNFTGNIPAFICRWRILSTLDLSENNFNGSIPRCLGNLKYTLRDLNLRQNLPGGTQFRRQNCTSFEDNPGLFGPSLDEICRDIHMPTPHETPESEEEEEEEEEVLTWIAAVIGVIPGIAFGWVIGYILVSYKPEWFMNPFVQSNEDAAATQLIKEVFDNLPEESERRNPKQPPCPNLD
ncbi:hypothetical protein DY000_02043458 [Brassica cretica]|uniref:Leucine-rich repeat-containing N-terminal plant-type domain-containing protein n=1 Tax=Brassica cretica TaxID=69181 RepID=A0ABQ7BKE8_BRACR|nr:hypothetical protein DY000_02043458 [Brassica cretica]